MPITERRDLLRNHQDIMLRFFFPPKQAILALIFTRGICSKNCHVKSKPSWLLFSIQWHRETRYCFLEFLEMLTSLKVNYINVAFLYLGPQLSFCSHWENPVPSLCSEPTGKAAISASITCAPEMVKLLCCFPVTSTWPFLSTLTAPKPPENKAVRFHSFLTKLEQKALSIYSLSPF